MIKIRTALIQDGKVVEFITYIEKERVEKIKPYIYKDKLSGVELFFDGYSWFFNSYQDLQKYIKYLKKNEKKNKRG